MSYPARAPLGGIDGMSYPARAPLGGIDGKARGACCRHGAMASLDNRSEAAA